jgi:hypothetical protein
MFLPLLSEADPKTSAEGSIDPLGLYAIADSLGVRLIQGVRERQAHPRFLTSIAVSLAVCADFPEETLARDGVSEPWQVFEWTFVEGMVRTAADATQLRGLPGQDKARQAVEDKAHLSARRYLKNPTVVGFHGVYRILARDIEVERADRLGEFGYGLVSTWEKEQGLEGFIGTGSGPGKDARRQLLDAVRDGIEKGSVARSGGWAGFQFFSRHLDIRGAGRKESKLITQRLLDPSGGFRSDVLNCLTGSAGKELWSREREGKSLSERRFHELLSKSAGARLKELLDGIGIYEQFSRLLQDAFDECLHFLSKNQKRILPTKLTGLEKVKHAAKKVPEIFNEVAERLAPFGHGARFQETFLSLSDRLPASEWVEKLLEHHCRIQQSKPPAGKAPWFDRFDDGSCMIRTAYLRDEFVSGEDRYVHAYRTRSLWSFAQDLGLVK